MLLTSLPVVILAATFFGAAIVSSFTLMPDPSISLPQVTKCESPLHPQSDLNETTRPRPTAERDRTRMFAHLLSLSPNPPHLLTPLSVFSPPPDLWHFTFLTFQTNLICFLYFSMCLVGHLLGDDTPLLAAWIPYVFKGEGGRAEWGGSGGGGGGVRCSVLYVVV